MPRAYRIVVPKEAHHVIQRGNRRQQVFFTDEDKWHYLELLRENSKKFNVHILGYCLMPNHVHLILLPESDTSMSKAVSQTHSRYTYRINSRMKWKGYLWQGRYNSFVMGDIYLLRCLRYIERNPVRSKMVLLAEDYLWSSARAHVNGTLGRYLDACPQVKAMGDWGAFLRSADPDQDIDQFRLHNLTGRPCGDDQFKQQVAIQLKLNIEDFERKHRGRPRMVRNVKE